MKIINNIYVYIIVLVDGSFTVHSKHYGLQFQVAALLLDTNQLYPHPYGSFGWSAWVNQIIDPVPATHACRIWMNILR